VAESVGFGRDEHDEEQQEKDGGEHGDEGCEVVPRIGDRDGLRNTQSCGFGGDTDAGANRVAPRSCRTAATEKQKGRSKTGPANGANERFYFFASVFGSIFRSVTSPFMVVTRISGPPPLRVPVTILPPVIGGRGGTGGTGAAGATWSSESLSS